MERRTGIEPVWNCLEGRHTPQSVSAASWCRRMELNHPRPLLQSGALPLSYIGNLVAGVESNHPLRLMRPSWNRLQSTPLSPARAKWCARPGSNGHRGCYEQPALPLSYKRNYRPNRDTQYGAARGNRTLDILLGKQVLYL